MTLLEVAVPCGSRLCPVSAAAPDAFVSVIAASALIAVIAVAAAAIELLSGAVFWLLFHWLLLPNAAAAAAVSDAPDAKTTLQYPPPLSLFLLCVAGVTAGYGDEVIFADGTFIDGSTAELSADGPIRPPYVVYCQVVVGWVVGWGWVVRW